MKKRILSAVLTVLLVLTAFPMTFASAAVMGDVDGDGAVKASDARLALRASVGLETLTDAQMKVADTDFDGVIKASDARLILRASVGLEILVDPHTHEYNKETVTKNATCTEKGEKKLSCECGEFILEEIPAAGHKPAADKAVAPGCTTAGKTEGSHCSVCSVVIKAQTTVNPTGHTVVTDKAVAATCTSTGKTEGSHCSVCSVVIKAQTTVAKKSHTPQLDESTKKAVTCKEDGYTGDYKCTVCNTVTTKGSVIESTGEEHTMERTTVDPSCTQDGYSVMMCTKCENFDADTVIAGEPATGHSYGKKSTVPPTCTQQGYDIQMCTACQVDLRSNFVSEKGHDYKWNTTQKATCKATGSKNGTCKTCGDTTTEIIPLTACTPLTVFVPGEGDVMCKNVTSCTVCEKVISTRETHQVRQVKSYEATCTEAATKDIACRNCNYQRTGVYVSDALGHDAPEDKSQYRAATCTVDGQKVFTGTCKRPGCGEELSDTIVVFKAKGHNETGVQTCTTAVTCTRCSDIIAPELGHSNSIYSVAYGKSIDTFFCDRCGKQTTDALTVFNNTANSIKTYNFYNGYSKQSTLYYVSYSTVDTTYSRFDFGIYTSTIKDLYEDEMAKNSKDYTPIRTGVIRSSLPLTSDYTTVSELTGSDIDSITVEKLNGLRASDILSSFDTKYTVGTKEYDLSNFKAVTVTEDVIKVTINIKNEKYSTVKNYPDSTKTALEKIYDMDIRDAANEFKNEKGELVLEENEKGDGFEISMVMRLLDIASDGTVTYYFRASNYEPIMAVYNVDVTMTQTIDMSFKIGLFSLNGEIDPVITTHYSTAFFFPNYFVK